MALKVLVVGSFQYSEAAGERRVARRNADELARLRALPLVMEREAAFRTACKALGAALVKAGVEIVVGTDDETDADHWIVAGAAEVDGAKPRVWVVRPADGAAPLFESLRGRLDLVVKQLSAPWASVQVAQIQQADAVIVIGGAYSTLSVGHSAPALGKPVLALPWFGGAALEVWHALQDEYARLQGENPIAGWSSSYSATEDDVRQALEALLRMRTQGLFRLQRLSPLVWAALTLATTIALLAAWVLVFGYPGILELPSQGPGRFFLLLGISALLGTFLRNSLRVVFDPNYTHNARAILAEVVCGLLLAFGLALLFLIGAITISGNPADVLTPAAGGFERVAVVMTLMGLGGGLMIEQAAEALRGWFSARFEDVLAHAKH